MALYRRYRPQTFQDVIGQEHVTRPLMAALRADRTAHAYLFSGPRGCGKTTSARILARCLNCAQAPTDTPCGQCESCRELSLGGGGSLDVVEMDAASHGGVDDARELIERAAFAPSRDRYKVFIIDEAHMVSTQGFNALLKLVEEPPAHIKFIFATTEPEKVIGTIRSRTHHYPFRLVPPEELEGYMAQICAEENIAVGAGVLPLVVRAGGGSVRDSLSVLDQLMGGSESGGLDYAQAIALLGYTDGSLLDDAVEAIAARDGATLFTVVERVVQSGHDPRRFVEDLLQRFRDVIVISLAREHAHDVLASVPQDQYERMLIQAEHLGAARASRAADLVNDALNLMVGATSPRLQMELLCARLLASSSEPGISGDAQRPRGGESSDGGTTRWEENNAAGRAIPGASSSRPAPPQRPAVAQRQPSSVKSGGNPTSPGRKISPAWAAQTQTSSVASPPVLSDAPMRAGGAAADSHAQADSRSHGQDVSAAPRSDVGVPLTPAAQTAQTLPPAGVSSSSPENRPYVEVSQGDGGGPGTGDIRVASVPASSTHGASVEGRKTQQHSPESASREPENSDHALAGESDGDLTLIRQRWKEVIDAIRVHSKSTAALVNERDAVIAGVREGVLGIQFRTAALATTFNERGHAPRVVAALSGVLGVDLQVRGFVGGESVPKEQAAREVASAVRQYPSAGIASQEVPRPSGQQNDGAHPARGENPQGVDGRAESPKRNNHPTGGQETPRELRSTGQTQRAEPSLSSRPLSASEEKTDSAEKTDISSHSRANSSGEVVRARPGSALNEVDRRPDARELEARGLVLASDDVALPSGPPPTRDELAAQLRALEAVHANQNADKRATHGQRDESGNISESKSENAFDAHNTSEFSVKHSRAAQPEDSSPSRVDAQVDAPTYSQEDASAYSPESAPTPQRMETLSQSPVSPPSMLHSGEESPSLNATQSKGNPGRGEQSGSYSGGQNGSYSEQSGPYGGDQKGSYNREHRPFPGENLSSQTPQNLTSNTVVNPDDPAGVLAQLIDRHGETTEKGQLPTSPASNEFYLPDEPPLEDEYALVPDVDYSAPGSTRDNLQDPPVATDAASRLLPGNETSAPGSFSSTPSNNRESAAVKTGNADSFTSSQNSLGSHGQDASFSTPATAEYYSFSGPDKLNPSQNASESDKTTEDISQQVAGQQINTRDLRGVIAAENYEEKAQIPQEQNKPERHLGADRIQPPPLTHSEEPFYAQKMPMPPRPGDSPASPVNAPYQQNPAAAHVTSTMHTPPQAEASTQATADIPSFSSSSLHTRSRDQLLDAEKMHTPGNSHPAEFSIPQRPASLGDSRGFGKKTGVAGKARSPIQSISERILATHGSGVAPRARISDEEIAKQRADEDEVSASDPTISQSDLVGIDVVLDTLKGAIIEEKPRENGSE